jgi:catabolite regulation protein CreA
VVFVVELTAMEGAKNPDLVVTAKGYAKGSISQGARPLASASVSCRQQGYINLESAVMKAMFDLDVALYRDGGLL